MKKAFAFLPLIVGLAVFTRPTPPAPPEIPADVQALLEKNGCAACHAIGRKLVGPKWTDIAAKGYSVKRITALVRKPEPANWPGYVPMVAQAGIPKAELTKIATWLVSIKE